MRRLEHMHIQLYNETFIVHANSTMPNVTKVLRTHVDRYNKVKKEIPYSQEAKSIALTHTYMTKQYEWRD
jgi:hypothetical protein